MTGNLCTGDVVIVIDGQNFLLRSLFYVLQPGNPNFVELLLVTSKRGQGWRGRLHDGRLLKVGSVTLQPREGIFAPEDLLDFASSVDNAYQEHGREVVVDHMYLPTYSGERLQSPV